MGTGGPTIVSYSKLREGDLGFILGSSAGEGRHQVDHDLRRHWASAGKAFLQLLGDERGLIRQGGVAWPRVV